MCLAIPGRVEAIEGESPEFRLARVDFSGVKKDVNLAFTPEVQVGDYVLVHVGFALNKVDEAEAQKIFEMLREVGALDEPEGGPE